MCERRTDQKPGWRPGERETRTDSLSLWEGDREGGRDAPEGNREGGERRTNQGDRGRGRDAPTLSLSLSLSLSLGGRPGGRERLTGEKPEGDREGPQAVGHNAEGPEAAEASEGVWQPLQPIAGHVELLQRRQKPHLFRV